MTGSEPPPQQWDIGDPEPVSVSVVSDDVTDGFGVDSRRWIRTMRPPYWWKGHKGGGDVYLTWADLVRRWGPVRETR